MKIKCKYRKCNIEFEPIDKRQKYCCPEHRIKENHYMQYEAHKRKKRERGLERGARAHRPKYNCETKHKICHTPGCTNKVAPWLYWLCESCYVKGTNGIDAEHRVYVPQP